MAAKGQQNNLIYRIDLTLILTVTALMVIGLIMVSSASIAISERRTGASFYYASHQFAYMIVALIGGGCVFSVPLKRWYDWGLIILMLSILSLVVVLIPGIGKTVNGASRWINLGFFTVQASEFVKIGIILYLARYLVCYQDLIKNDWKGSARPFLLIGVVAMLLMLEPDFGATVVILSTAMAMLFLANVPIRYFLGVFCVAGCSLGILAVSSPYRVERLTSFLDPWANQFDSGYQLTQALIAFGRGEWFGVGLGSSVQKLFYLPEAHTDFLFAVIAEELGLVGGLLIVALFTLFIVRGLYIAFTAKVRGDAFASLVAYGITLWIGLQAFINIGVNTGLLPTKGLTLPLMSYGANSLLSVCMALGILLRVDYENRAKA